MDKDALYDAVTDMLGKPLEVNDYVVFTNNIYQVQNLGNARGSMGRFNRYQGTIGIKLINPSPTTKTVKKNPKLMVKLHPGDILFLLLKK
jgi:hypothetical protein